MGDSPDHRSCSLTSGHARPDKRILSRPPQKRRPNTWRSPFVALFLLGSLTPLSLHGQPPPSSGGTISNSALLLPSEPSPTSAGEDIRDIAPPLEIPGGWTWLWWIAALVALLAFARFLYKRRKKKADRADAPPPVPPHARARERLRRALSWIDDPRLFCGEVSVTLRVYLEERFDFHAPERTTEEFLLELKATNLLVHDQKLSLADFLQQCDLVKFARHEPPEEELRALHDSALRLIDETQFDAVRPNPAPAPAHP